MKIDRRWLALPLVIGAALVLGGTSSARTPGPGPVGGAAGVRALVQPVANLMGMPELADFLMAKAYTESRFNPGAGSCVSNQACGLYGLREQSAGIDGKYLHDPRWSTLAAADYAWRLGHKGYDFPGQVVTWGALARGWALPKLVSDVDWSEDRSQDVLDRFEAALDHVGLPHSFIDRAAYPPGARHPGKPALAAALGLGGIS